MMENVFSADYAFAQDVMDEVETIVDRVGPLSFVKNILLFYLEDHGIHDGVVWECVVNLSESAHESPSYRKHMDALLADYGEDRYPKVGQCRQDSANLQACLTATGCILAGLSVAKAPLELPYTVCGLIVDSDWGFDKLHEGMMQMLPPPGHHAGGNGDAQPCC
ncbi:hypothetical protein [Corynebacterium matruchotii]|uniref:hypothetical protein n=1 Tax=Corynebacterium matruchotii TaxID=43768 RepID=UPI0028EB76F7|nr:hypothetical protein [Corynebacterium matruchotii]